MELPAGYLQVGSSINIKRTDGRVHSAIVAAINNDQRCATVEWFEEGETKGKEVDMAAIESLNPDVIILKPGEELKLNKLDSSGYSEDEMSASMSQSGQYSDDEFNSNQFSSQTTSFQNPTQRHVGAKTNNGLNRATLKPTQIASNNGHLNALTENTLVPNALPTGITTSKSTTNVQNSRRSNVVKEVERLKKNREERRQRQAEEKEAKEAFLKMDPGNPHWELLNMIMEYRRGLEIKTLTDGDPIEDHLITVCVRKRPLNQKETARKEVDVITIPSKNQLIVHEPKNKVDLTKYLENQLFRFDYAFDERCSNDIVYKYTAKPLIKTIFDGGFATCFAYGQTGSGKTHTMGGAFKGKDQDCGKGIYAMAANDVFLHSNSPKYRHLNLVISASFFEIYSGKVFDLLNKKQRLKILEDGKQKVVVVGLTEMVVCTTEEVLKLIHKGNQARTSGQTFANMHSSRSHAVFQIYLRSNVNGQTKIHGKFSLIDLAGNERGADTSSANRQTRMEGAEINKSLLALKECIRALGRRGAHLPFRVSKLTQVLRDSFVGPNSRTCMIAMISPGVSSCEHSLNTLRYADRVKELGGGDLQTNTGSEPEQIDDGDLSQLRSFNETDMTPEMLNFHQVISELQVAEDSMLDNHKQTVEALKKAYHRANTLQQMTEEVDYDQEVYCRDWDLFLRDMMDTLSKAKKHVDDYKNKLTAEEQLSRKTTKRK
ncbi:kinesin-like protein Klp10A isoform X1 [Euwallacea similis]|uniref:kinesin-like protein Klp10A isoform X1 n=1 Tax=Euwallacea similis TaxID=1736056 RepID=UPI003450FB3A